MRPVRTSCSASSSSSAKIHPDDEDVAADPHPQVVRERHHAASGENDLMKTLSHQTSVPQKVGAEGRSRKLHCGTRLESPGSQRQRVNGLVGSSPVPVPVPSTRHNLPSSHQSECSGHVGVSPSAPLCRLHLVLHVHQRRHFWPC